MGTPEFAAIILRAVIATGHEIAAVYTQPPRPAGRGMALVRSAVHDVAEQNGLPVLTPVNFKAETDRQGFAALNCDAAIVVAYGLLLPKAVLDAPRLGCFNVHASKLPRWRGAAPIQRAIIAGDRDTAVMLMRMEEGLDTGRVCRSTPVAISDAMTAADLHDRLAAAGAALVAPALAALEQGTLRCEPQAAEGVTYARKIEKSEARIDFHRPAVEVGRHIHGLSPFPGAWLEIEIGGRPERIKILRAVVSEAGGEAGTVIDDRFTIACARGSISPIELQRAGKRAVSLEEFRRGATIAVGQRVL